MNSSKIALILTLLCLLAATVPFAFAVDPPDTINTVAGGGPNNAPAAQANVDYPGSAAWDSAGNYYIVSQNQERVYKVSTSGVLTVLAGDGTYGYGGDGGPATKAQLHLDTYSAVAADSFGNVYIADTYNYVVRVVNASTGIIRTFAGTPGSYGFSGDLGPATSAQLTYPEGLAVDGSNNVFISDLYNYRIREVTAIDGNINTVAGNGTPCYGNSNYPCGDTGLATGANLAYIYSIAVDSAGNVFAADSYYYNQVVRLFSVNGNITTVAGNYSGAGGISPCIQSSTVSCGDGGPATSAGFYYPYGIGSDAAGNLFIADQNNYDVREVVCADSAIKTCNAGAKTAGSIYTVAGIGGSPGYSGDGGVATSAQFSTLYGTLGVDASDDILIGDYNNLRVREVFGTGVNAGNVDTVAGNGTLYYYGNNVPATGAELNSPQAVATDGNGNLYIADTNNCVVRKVDNTGLITLFAGTTGVCGYGGDGHPATAAGAELYYPISVAADAAGNVYIADFYDGDIREVDTSGNLSTVVGANGPTSHPLYYARGLAVTADGSKIYVSQQYYCTVQQWDGSNLTVVAGVSNNCGFNGDGTATSHWLYYPAGMALAPDGSLYIADQYNHRIRKLDTSGNLTSVAGNGGCTFEADGVPALDSSLCYPIGVGVDVAGDVLISDTNNTRIRFVNGGESGTIHTAAGSSYGLFGDGGLGINALLTYPQELAVDASGNIYFPDLNNNRIREISAIPNINSSTPDITFDLQPVNTTSTAQQVTLAAAGPITLTSITPTAPFTESDNCSGITSGQTCNVNIYFTPPSSGTFTGTLTVASNAFFGPLTISLTGTATAVVISPTALGFPPTTVGSTSLAQNVTVTNKGGSSLNFGTVSASGDFHLVTATTNPCVSPLPKGASCNFALTFKPTAQGQRLGTLTINDSDGSSPQFVSLSGTGTNGASVSPTILPFGNQNVGTATKSPKTVTVSYKGTGTLTLTGTSFTGPNAADFTVVGGGGCTGSIPGPGNCTYKVSFTPSVEGSETATMNINETAPGGSGTLVVNLSGTGVGDGASVTPTKLAFGNQAVFIPTKTPKTVTVNYIGPGNLTFSGAPAFSGPYMNDFSVVSGGTCTGTLASPGSCTYLVSFTPSVNATVVLSETATMSINDSSTAGAAVQTVALSGTGTGDGASVFPTKLNFGAVPHGGIAPVKTVTVTNNGQGTLSLSGTSITGTGAQYYSAGPGALNPCGSSLNSLAKCTYDVTFTSPSTAGVSAPATLNIGDSSSAGSASQTVALSGSSQ